MKGLRERERQSIERQLHRIRPGVWQLERQNDAGLSAFTHGAGGHEVTLTYERPRCWVARAFELVRSPIQGRVTHREQASAEGGSAIAAARALANQLEGQSAPGRRRSGARRPCCLRKATCMTVRRVRGAERG